MKKILLSIFICVLFISYSNAQYVSLGLKAGGQFANVSTDVDGLETSGIIGFHGGAFFKLKTPAKFGGKIEALYSTRGTDYSSSVTNPLNGQTIETTGEFRASYIDIPLMLTFNVIKQVAFEVGPQFSLLMNGETSAGGQTVDYEPKNDPEIGLAIGVDVNLPKKLGAYARYNLGFNSQDDGAGGTNQTNQSWIQLGLKYRIFEPI